MTPDHTTRRRARDCGIELGVVPPGKLNAITDVRGVKVGQVTIADARFRTGVTAILPHDGNLFQAKVPAAIHVGNGFGKLIGATQVQELGTIETPIVLTNTLSAATAATALIRHTLAQEGNESVVSVNPVVGETNDGKLNDIRALGVSEEHVRAALAAASGGPVQEGNVGAGTGTEAFGWKGGIGTASRVLPRANGGWTVGALVQSNFGGVLQIAGAPVGRALGRHDFAEALQQEHGDGSCMMVVVTDAPLCSRNLGRIAKRGMLGLARTGGIASHGSGDYVIAASTADSVRIRREPPGTLRKLELLADEDVTPLFLATIEAVEEALINSLFMAETMTARGRTVEALPIDAVLRLLRATRGPLALI